MELSERLIIEIKKNSIYRMEENLRMVLICFDKITENDLWNKPSKKGVAFGNQIIHIVGNITQYLTSALGEKKINRERDKEFKIDKSISKTSLINILSNTIEESKKTINALSKSNGANNSDLLIYLDGPKNQKDVKIQDQINLFIDNLNGKFLTIKKIHNKNNQGLGKSIISGLNNTFKEYESAIILEDDIVVSNNFLNYCNEALKLYKNTNIFHISGWSPVCEKNMKPYLTNYMACWGWATWRSKWAEYQKDPEKIIHYFKKNPYQ